VTQSSPRIRVSGTQDTPKRTVDSPESCERFVPDVQAIFRRPRHQARRPNARQHQARQSNASDGAGGCKQAEPEEDQPNKSQKPLVEATTRTTSRTVLLWVQSLLSLQHQFHKTSHSRERQGPSSCQLHLYIEREIQAVVNSGDKTVDAAIQLRSRGPAKNAALISPDRVPKAKPARNSFRISPPHISSRMYCATSPRAGISARGGRSLTALLLQRVNVVRLRDRHELDRERADDLGRTSPVGDAEARHGRTGDGEVFRREQGQSKTADRGLHSGTNARERCSVP
jgi:hypothetical protein